MSLNKGEVELGSVLMVAGAAVILYFAASALGIQIGAGAITYGTYTITSMDNVSIITNPIGENLPSGEYWLINLNTQQTSGYDQLYGESQEGELTYENWKNGKGIRLNMEITKPISCEMQLGQSPNTAGNKIVKLQTLKFQLGDILYPPERDNVALQQCSDNGGQYVVRTNWDVFKGYQDYICIKEIVVGIKGIQTQAATLDWGEKFTLTRDDGLLATASVSPTATSASLITSDNSIIGKVRWDGNLLGDSLACQYDLNNFVPVYGDYTTINNHWIIADLQDVSNWDSAFLNFLSQYPDNGLDGQEQTVNYLVNTVNNWALHATENTQSPPYNQANIIQQSPSSATVEINAQGNPIFPQISLYISTAFMPKVAIVQTGGQPKWIYKEDVSFQTTKSAQGRATVKNIGGASGVFQITADCPYSVSVAPSTTSALYPNGEAQIYYDVSGTCAQTETKTCSLTARDVNSQLTDTTTFTATCEPLCTKTCGIKTHLDTDTCACVCDLSPPYHWNFDNTACSKTCFAPTTPCEYGQDPDTCLCNPPPDCSLTCPTTYTPNEACNACVCSLDPNGAPNGQVLDSENCKYVDKGGLSEDEIYGLIMIGIALLVVVVIIYMLRE